MSTSASQALQEIFRNKEDDAHQDSSGDENVEKKEGGKSARRQEDKAAAEGYYTAYAHAVASAQEPRQSSQSPNPLGFSLGGAAL